MKKKLVTGATGLIGSNLCNSDPTINGVRYAIHAMKLKNETNLIQKP
jgi:FlaA1/EpsC-like NDP-sugar epimerase